MDSIRLNHEDDGWAIAQCAGALFNPTADISICRVRDEHRLGGVLFSNFTEESIGIHSASWVPRWINRDLLFITFDYPFNQLGVKRIFGTVPEDNLRARKFNDNLGFRTVARVPGVYKNDVACLVMCLERDECRFLRVRPRSLRPTYPEGQDDGRQVISA